MWRLGFAYKDKREPHTCCTRKKARLVTTCVAAQSRSNAFLPGAMQLHIDALFGVTGSSRSS